LILQMSNIPTLDIRFCPYNVTFIFAYPSWLSFLSISANSNN
jgi:hypothetical protein